MGIGAECLISVERLLEDIMVIGEMEAVVEKKVKRLRIRRPVLYTNASGAKQRGIALPILDV